MYFHINTRGNSMFFSSSEAYEKRREITVFLTRFTTVKNTDTFAVTEKHDSGDCFENLLKVKHAISSRFSFHAFSNRPFYTNKRCEITVFLIEQTL